MTESNPSKMLKSPESKQKDLPEIMCCGIFEGCIRHNNKQSKIEEKFLLRLPEKEAKVVYEALETNSLGNHISVAIEKTQRNASVVVDDRQFECKVIDLPINSEKTDNSRIIICDSSENIPAQDKPNSDLHKTHHPSFSHATNNNEVKYVQNERKNRFHKIAFEVNFEVNSPLAASTPRIGARQDAAREPGRPRVRRQLILQSPSRSMAELK